MPNRPDFTKTGAELPKVSPDLVEIGGECDELSRNLAEVGGECDELSRNLVEVGGDCDEPPGILAEVGRDCDELVRNLVELGADCDAPPSILAPQPCRPIGHSGAPRASPGLLRRKTMLDLQLDGKRALVTGSSSGIGEAIARTLAAQGAVVVVHGRNAERAWRVADEINGAGPGRAFVALGDLSRQEEADRVARSAIDALGGVDVLVDNAGRGAPRSGWLDATVEEWEQLFEDNLFSAVRMIRALVPGMKERGWGRVIQIASVVATQPHASSPAYAASKAAMVNLTGSLAKELAGTGVTVNTVSPGPVVTPLFDQAMQERGADRERLEVSSTYVGRFGRPEEIADLVAFLASPRADFIDGTNVHIDGGRRDLDLLSGRVQPQA